MRQVMAALALGTAAMATTAGAQVGTGRGTAGAIRGDADGDGAVSRAEYQAEVDARFARLDANGDGKLDTAEMPMRAIGRRDLAATAAAPAPDGSAAGDIPRERFRSAAMLRFERLDGNGDGRIDAAEMDAARPARGRAQAVPAPTPPADPR